MTTPPEPCRSLCKESPCKGNGGEKRKDEGTRLGGLAFMTEGGFFLSFDYSEGLERQCYRMLVHSLFPCKTCKPPSNTKRTHAKTIKDILLRKAKLSCDTPHRGMVLTLKGYSISENNSTNSWKKKPVMTPGIQMVLELEGLQGCENTAGKLLARLPCNRALTPV